MRHRLRYFAFLCIVCCICSSTLSLVVRGKKPGAAPASTPRKTSSKKTTPKQAPDPAPGGGGGGGNNPSTKYVGPKLFIGGAFDGAMRQLSNDPALVPARVGYHLHPMGLGSAEGGGYLRNFLKNFKTKWYFYESDFDAWTDGTNPLQTNTPGVWGSKLNAAASSPSEWKCAGFWGYYSKISAVIHDTAGYIQRTKALKNRIKAWGCGSYFVGWAPPSPEGLQNDGVLRTRKTMFNIAKAVGATGIVLDFPADLWNDGTCRQQAIDAYNDCRSVGMSFGWCFNGRESVAAVSKAVQGILAAGIKPTFWSIDAFYPDVTGRALYDQTIAISRIAKV